MSLSILLTGGAGFVGSAIIDAIRESHPEWRLIVLDMKEPAQPSRDVEYIAGDITATSAMMEALEKAKPRVVIHTAGLVPPVTERYARRMLDEVFKVNVQGTRNMLAAARNAGVQAFVYTSSCTVITDDLKHDYKNVDETWPVCHDSTIYGESKAAAETLVVAASCEKMATCVLRPSSLIGPGDTLFIPSIHACIANGQTPFVIGSGVNLCDITYVTNVADAHVLAVENLLSTRSAAGEAFFISNHEPVPFRDLLLAVWAHFGHYPPFEVSVPKPLGILVGKIAEGLTLLTGIVTSLSSGSISDACSTRYCNGTKAKKLLGYEPRVGLEEGVRLSCRDYARRLEKEATKVVP